MFLIDRDFFFQLLSTWIKHSLDAEIAGLVALDGDVEDRSGDGVERDNNARQCCIQGSRTLLVFLHTHNQHFLFVWMHETGFNFW